MLKYKGRVTTLDLELKNKTKQMEYYMNKCKALDSELRVEKEATKQQAKDLEKLSRPSNEAKLLKEAHVKI